MSEQQIYHIPALLNETIDGLNIIPNGVYVDVTFGGGGHSRQIIKHLGDKGKLFGFDQDMDAYANNIADERFTFVHSNFRYLQNFLKFYGIEEVDGILADLGVSFHHFDDGDRGFSFRYDDAKLDMRMSRDNDIDAKTVINTYSEQELTRILKLFGDLKNAKRIALAITKARDIKPLDTIADLLNVVKPLTNPRQEKKELSQIFQAFRMEVNHEVDALAEFLQQAIKVLKPGGRLAIITYHSIEDRMVKNFIKSGNIDGKVDTDFFGNIKTNIKPLTKPIAPSDSEINLNPRARSAKLRIATKTNEIEA